jgi:F-type H+-transporting ATPase subunit delta
MSVTTVARRYAEAVADVAIARNQADQVDAELNHFTQMMQASRELHDVFASPIISSDQKSRVLEAIVGRTQPSPMTANLLRTMLKNYRLHLLDAVYEQYRREINDRKGVAIADVTTAAPLAASEQDLLSRRLRELTGKQVHLQFKIDPAIIGGIITRIGSVDYDGSIRTQLQAVKQRLKTGDR